MDGSRLAIVVPAYKPDFLREALSSIGAQTDDRFTVYVGDDAGPPELEVICSDFPALDLVYRRFPENVGERSLSAQWNRCVALSDEPWVWLFADDDVMSPECVAAFHDEIDGDDTARLVRFQTDVIDGEGHHLATNPPHPPTESREDFVLDRLQGRRKSFAVEYVFRRRAFDEAGGFPHYPLAWCADDVAWYAFAGDAHIRTLRRGRVRWRASGRNITDAKGRHRSEKMEAALAFLDFVEAEVRPSSAYGGRSPAVWDEAMETWLQDQLRYLMPMGPELLARALRESASRWQAPTAVRAGLLAAWNVQAGLRTLRGLLRRIGPS